MEETKTKAEIELDIENTDEFSRAAKQCVKGMNRLVKHLKEMETRLDND